MFINNDLNNEIISDDEKVKKGDEDQYLLK